MSCAMSSVMMLRLSWMGCMLLSTFVSSVPMAMVLPVGSPALRAPLMTDVAGRGDAAEAVDDGAAGVTSLAMVEAADDVETMSTGSKKQEENEFEGGGAPTISEGDNRKQALLALYNATDGDSWVYDGNVWVTNDDDPCDDKWSGVTCDNDKKITELDLYEYGLNGALPSDIGDLTNLKALDLALNQLNGTIPTEIGQLEKLEVLSLYDNQLSGMIPTEIGQLEKLQVLDLEYNQLSGMIPTEIGQLEKLEDLSLEENQLSGTIPTEIGQLEKLEDLFLYDNQLSGMIPTEIGQLEKLEDLSLYDNQLSGMIPTEIGQLEKLEVLDL
eukprot:scaffold33892_cov49-Attheya_sp.AAC.1